MTPPFDADRLDTLMDDIGVDAVVAVTRFNVQYMLGGYRYFFFANMDAIGLSRYLPALVYRKGAPADAFYVGCGNEAWGVDVFPLWVPDLRLVSWSSVDTARAVASGLRDRGLAAGNGRGREGVPARRCLGRPARRAARGDVRRGAEAAGGDARDQVSAELDLVRTASIGIIDSMLATFAGAVPGETKAEIVERFRREQTNRGMIFDYCLVAAGPNQPGPVRSRLARGRRAVAGLRRDVPGLHRRPGQNGGGGRTDRADERPVR